MNIQQLIQRHNQVLIDDYHKIGPVNLGPYSSYTWRRDPRHLFFTLSRYKFCSKMLQGKKSVLEVGCGDAVGAPLLLQNVERLHCVDLEPVIIEDDRKRNEFGERLTFQAADLTEVALTGNFDAVVSLDVLEHITSGKEDQFLYNLRVGLHTNGVCIIGTPNITSDQFASTNSRDGHINLKSHDTLRSSLQKHFQNIFLFGMNDEVVHTGFLPMAHYLFALCVSPR